jgi:hypothetical protein
MDVLKKWIEFKELIELEREDTTRDSKGGFQHTITMVESSITKRPQKEETKAHMYIYILGKIVMGKEAKGFKHVECHIKDATIDKEYANLFPLGFSPVKGVNLPINFFKRSPP